VSDQVALFKKPNASICLPIHPFGQIRLWEKALQQLISENVPVELAGDLDSLSTMVAGVVGDTYQPGGSVRDGMNRILEGRNLPLRAESPITEQMAIDRQREDLAIYPVVRALAVWAVK